VKGTGEGAELPVSSKAIVADWMDVLTVSTLWMGREGCDMLVVLVVSVVTAVLLVMVFDLCVSSVSVGKLVGDPKGALFSVLCL
jgi:hypothetical protein